MTSPLRSTSPMPAKVCVGHSEENTRRYYPLLLSHVTRMLTPFQVMPGVLLLSLSVVFFFFLIIITIISDTRHYFTSHTLSSYYQLIDLWPHTHTHLHSCLCARSVCK